KLSSDEKSQMTRKPTENGEAYLAFVQAHNLQSAIEDFEKLNQSEQLYQRAIDLDPKFALAIARYSQLQSWFVNGVERTPERLEKTRTCWRTRLCNFSLTCRKRTWRWGSHTITATRITTQR